jgi:4-hydroxy-3-methylbut-2-enyl diphosphate reductase
MNVIIDKHSGFCSGVVHAVEIAERELRESSMLYCLGDIVHNNMECERLKKMGLVIIGPEEFKNLRDCKVLIRAHGEPPETFRIALENNIRLIDATCRIVLNLQKEIRESYAEVEKKNGQVIIYGKKGHAEMKGLTGQVNGKAIVVGDENDIERIDFTRPVRLYAQTTKSAEGLQKIVTLIRDRMTAINPAAIPDFIWHDSICRHVSKRSVHLKEFATRFDVVIFVSGRESSNGIALYQVCKAVNPSTWLVSDAGELKKEWFNGSGSVGICGATSTPLWLMEEVGKAVQSI